MAFSSSLRARSRSRCLALLVLFLAGSLCLDLSSASSTNEGQPKTSRRNSEVVESSSSATNAADVESYPPQQQQQKTPSSPEECTASTGREFLIALGTPACRVILLAGVVSVYDADFVGIEKVSRAKVDADSGFARTTAVTIRSADGGGTGGSVAAAMAAAASWRARSISANSNSSDRTPASVAAGGGDGGPVAHAALETATRLTFHVDVPKGVVVELEDLSIAGISRAPPAAIRVSHRNNDNNNNSTSSVDAAAAAGVDRAGARGGGAMFSVFHVHDGGTVKISRCDLRAKHGACAPDDRGGGAATSSSSSSNKSNISNGDVVGGSIDSSLLVAGDPEGRFHRIDHGDMLIEQATVHPLVLFGVDATVLRAEMKNNNNNAPAMAPSSTPRRLFALSSPSSPPSSSSSSQLAPRLVITDTVIWCPETGFVRAGRPSAPGEGRASVASRVSTSLELSSALGSVGSRTVLCEDDLILPRASPGRPAMLVQDRDVSFRVAPEKSSTTPLATSDGGSSSSSTKKPIRLLCLHEMGARDCVFPVIAAGPGGSLSLHGLAIEAPDPGCPVQPATRCSYRGHELPRSLRGTLLPAGAVGVAGGGWLVFSGVDISYDYCTEDFESAVRAIYNGSAGTGDGVSLNVVDANNNSAGTKNNGDHDRRVTFACTHCDFSCFVPGGDARGELPAMVSFRNMTIGCAKPLPGSLKKRAGSGVKAVKSNGTSGGGNGVGGTTTMTSLAQAAAESSEASLSSSSTNNSPLPSSSSSSTKLSTAALAATLAAGGAAIAAAALGAALGARTVAKRNAASTSAANNASPSSAAGAASAAAGGSRRDDDDDSAPACALSSTSAAVAAAPSAELLASSPTSPTTNDSSW